MSDTKEILHVVSERVAATAGARLAFGEPVHAQGKTIIPVARAAFGFGAGSGGPKGRGPDAPAMEGGGGGGGGGTIPIGVVEITAESTRFIRFSIWKPLLAAAALGLLLGFSLRRQKSGG